MKLGHRAFQHRQHAIGDIVLQAEHAQRRAALAGGIEGRGQRVDHELLGQAPRNWPPARSARRSRRSAPAAPSAGAAGELPVDRARDLGRAGEDDAGDRADCRPARADLAVAGQQLQRPRGTPASWKSAHGLGGDQRRLLRRLGDHRIAGRQRAGDLAGEDRQRKVPRADAGDDTERPVRVVATISTAPRSSAGSRPPPSPRRRRCRKSCRPRARSAEQRLQPRLHQVGGRAQAVAARAAGVRLPEAWRARRRHRHAPASPRSPCRHVAPVGGIPARGRRRSRGPSAAAPRQPSRPAGSPPAPPEPARWRDRARRVAAPRRTARAARRSVGCGAPSGWRFAPLDRIGQKIVRAGRRDRRSG